MAYDKNKIGQVGSRQGKRNRTRKKDNPFFPVYSKIKSRLREMMIIFCVFTVEDSDLTESDQYRAGQGIIPHVPYLPRRDP